MLVGEQWSVTSIVTMLTRMENTDMSYQKEFEFTITLQIESDTEVVTDEYVESAVSTGLAESLAHLDERVDGATHDVKLSVGCNGIDMNIPCTCCGGLFPDERLDWIDKEGDKTRPYCLGCAEINERMIDYRELPYVDDFDADQQVTSEERIAAILFDLSRSCTLSWLSIVLT
jgi:hypothetical protein